MTAADPTRLEALGGERPATPLAVGLARFVEWYRAHPSLAKAVLEDRAGEGAPR